MNQMLIDMKGWKIESKQSRDQVKTEGHKTIVDTHLYLLNPVVVLLIQYITMPKMKERKKTPNLYLSSKPILTEGKLLYAPKGNSTYHF